VKKWRCSVCGYIFDGDAAPEFCPKCKAPREKFTEVPTDTAQLIERSRFTNDLLMELATLASKVEVLAAKGIEDNLDPGCLGVFKAAKTQAEVLKQMSKAEIQTHISKGKWG
jgi:hypothetical protein